MRGAGLIAYSCSPVINNNTITENRLLGGVYGASRGGGLWSSSASSFSGVNNIVYSNFAEENPECYGSVDFTYSCVSTITPGTGNIVSDPVFVNPAQFDFNLQASSPCIDAGDPASRMDPDSTRADMGALYFDQNRLYLTLTPNNPPVTIPAGGGSFGYTVSLANNSLSAVAVDVWTEVRFPNGISLPLLRRYGISVPSGAVLSRELTQNVPGSIPPGVYSYSAKAGGFPDAVMAYDSFDFEKTVSRDEGSAAYQGGWIVTGWEENTNASLILNSQFSILNSSPNPFNASTALSFVLQAASRIELTIYDISGREVLDLVDAFYPAGTHQVVWDASAMSSGVFFARLEAGGSVETVKIILMK